MNLARGPLIAAWIATAAIAIGAIGPWATVGVIHTAGLDGSNDGWITLVCAGAAALVVWQIALTPRLGWRLFLSALGFVALIVAIVDIIDIRSRHAEIFGATISANVGWGLWLTAFAAATIVVIGITYRPTRVDDGGAPR